MQLLAVNYHYIRDVKPSKGIYPRSIDEMAFQLDKLGQYYDFISQEELLKIVRSKKYPKGNYCVITFDDNLKEQMKAYEYLEKNSILKKYLSIISTERFFMPFDLPEKDSPFSTYSIKLKNDKRMIISKFNVVAEQYFIVCEKSI